jgi:hypothetical protein
MEKTAEMVRKGKRKPSRGILTENERQYLTSNQKKVPCIDTVIKRKTERTLREDLPLIASLRPAFLNVQTFHTITYWENTLDYKEDIADEPQTSRIFEKRLIDAIGVLYTMYENELTNRRIKDKSKQKISQKEIFKFINKTIRAGKAEIRQRKILWNDYLTKKKE